MAALQLFVPGMKPLPAIVCCLLLLGACSHHAVYPDNWKPLPKNPPEKCEVPTGLYLNEPAESRDGSELRHVFNLEDGDHIRLQLGEQDTLTAQAVRHGEVLESRTFDIEAGKPVCRNGWLLFRSKGWDSGQAGFGYQASVTGLLVHDNYLVVKQAGSFAGWVYIMPYVGSGSAWHRFRYIGDPDLETLRREAQQLRDRGYLKD